MTARLNYKYVPGSFSEAFKRPYKRMAIAAQMAITRAGEAVKSDARAKIASSGLGQRFVQALRVDIYPKGRASLNASAHVYHRIPYAGVFEEGAKVRGRPFMWLPLSTTPKKIGRTRISAKLFEEKVGPLTFVKKPGKKPLLAAKMSQGRSKTATKVTLPRLRAAAGGAAKGPFVSVPLFVGVNAVNIRKRLNITAFVRRARAALPQLYAQFFRAG